MKARAMANKRLSAGDETLRQLLAGVGFDDDESESSLVFGAFGQISPREARSAAASRSGGNRSGGGGSPSGGGPGGSPGGGGEGEEV